jgi:hypothetical protein
VLDYAWRRSSPVAKRLLAAIVAADFVAVMSVNGHVRYGTLPAELQGVLPRFKVEYAAGDEALLNAPRDCSFAGPGPPGQANVIPDRFSWSGYTNLISGQYLGKREQMRWALCGPSRLWDHAARQPHPYTLDHYTPGSIRFRTQKPANQSGLLLLGGGGRRPVDTATERPRSGVHGHACGSARNRRFPRAAGHRRVGRRRNDLSSAAFENLAALIVSSMHRTTRPARVD